MSASPSHPPPSLWRNLSFHLLWTSTFFSGVGDRMIMNAALGMLGYPLGEVNDPGSASEVASIQAGIQFFFFLPYLLWSPMAGWLTDRLPRKWILFTADELRGLIVLAAVALLPAGVEVVVPEQRWMVWAVILLVGVMAATFVPAKLSIVPNVVGWAMLTRANAAVVSMGIIGNLIGFIVGGLLVEHSVRAMILTSAGCYLVSGLFWLFLKTPWKKRTRERAVRVDHPVRDIRQGLRYALDHRPIRILILTLALIWTGVAVYMPALAVVNLQLYGQGAAGLMFVMAPVGLGMLLAAVVVGTLNPRLGNEMLIALGLVVCGGFIGLQMIVPSFGLGVAIALGTGLGAGLILVPLNTMLQRCSADHVRGRVFAAKEVVQELGQVVVSFVIWQAGAAADPAMRPTTAAYAVLLIVAAVWGFRRYVLVGPLPTGMLNFLWRFCRLYSQAVHRLVAVGRHRVPARGPVLIVANHISGVDPCLIQAAVPRVLRWLMAREYMVRPLGWFWRAIEPIPVNRDEPDAAAARAAIARLRRGEVVAIFPEGGIHHARDRLGEFGEGVSLIARRGGAWVVPALVTGTPANVGPFRSYFRPSRSRVVFGEPFELDAAADRTEQIRVIRDRIERLRSADDAAS